MKISTGLATVLGLLQLLSFCTAAGHDRGAPPYPYAGAYQEQDDIDPSNWDSVAGSRSWPNLGTGTQHRSTQSIEGFEHGRGYPGQATQQSYMQQAANYQHGDPFEGVLQYLDHGVPQGHGYSYSGLTAGHGQHPSPGVEPDSDMFSARSMHVALDQQGGGHASPMPYGHVTASRPNRVDRDPREMLVSMTQPYRDVHGGMNPASYDAGSARHYNVLDTRRIAPTSLGPAASSRYQIEGDGTVGGRSGIRRNKGKHQLTEPSQASGWEHEDVRQVRRKHFVPGMPYNIEPGHASISRLGAEPQARTGVGAIEVEPVSSDHRPMSHEEKALQARNKQLVDDAEQELSRMIKSHNDYIGKEWNARPRRKLDGRVLTRVQDVQTAWAFLQKDQDYVLASEKTVRDLPPPDQAQLWASAVRTLQKLKSQLGLYDKAMSLLHASWGTLEEHSRSKALKALNDLEGLSKNLNDAIATVRGKLPTSMKGV